MTVRELIVQLMAQPQDATVVVNAGKNELANGKAVGKIRLIDTIVHEEDYGTYYWINYCPEQPAYEGEVLSKAVNITP